MTELTTENSRLSELADQADYFASMLKVTRINWILARDPLFYLNFHPLAVVSRYRDPQLQVSENYYYLFNLRPTVFKFISK